MKMEADGSFLLKNLGKSLVFLNGKEIAIGQSMSLRSNSLIEVCGFPLSSCLISFKLFEWFCRLIFNLCFSFEIIILLALICCSVTRELIYC